MKRGCFYELYWFLLFLLTVFTACIGQEKPIGEEEDPIQELSKLLYPPTHQQIAPYIRNMMQDKNGHLWLGTNGYGAVHFNGDSLFYYSRKQGFAGTQITGMAQDKEGNLWFSTDRGVVKYDWSTTENGEKTFINFKDPKASSNSRIWSILPDSKGIIWLGTVDGVYRLEGTNYSPFELPYTEEEGDHDFHSTRTIWSITEDRQGNIWFGTNGNGAFKYDGHTFYQYMEKDGLTDNSVDHILEDSNGNIWFGTRFGGLSHFDGTHFLNYTQNDSIGSDEVYVVCEDKAGNIWFSSKGYGVYRYDGKVFTNFYEEKGLRVRAVQTIFEDNEGRLWVGGGGGLFQFNGQSFFNVTKNGPWK